MSLDGANTAEPSFVPTQNGTFEFALTVTDGRAAQFLSENEICNLDWRDITHGDNTKGDKQALRTCRLSLRF